MSADNQDFPDSGDDGRDRTWIAVHAASAIPKASKELDTATIDRAGRVLIDIAEAHAKPVELPNRHPATVEPFRPRRGDWIVSHGYIEGGALLVLTNSYLGDECVDVDKFGMAPLSLCRRATDDEIAKARGEK